MGGEAREVDRAKEMESIIAMLRNLARILCMRRSH